MAETQTTGHGRPVSWLAVVWIVAAFTVGGVALCTNPPTWWLFWAALGATSAGVAFAFAIDMMSDFTTEDM